MDEKEVKAIVKMTVEELANSGLIVEDKAKAYIDTAEMLKDYYADDERDERISMTLRRFEADYYYRIIPLYFGLGYTNEQIAEKLGVETSTVVRNKKRLCVAIWRAMKK